jgi:pimeloyl-ACP methyl ester carboxylesterase
MIEINARSLRLALAGDVAGLRALAAPHREALLNDAEAWMDAVLAGSPEEDRAVLSDPTFSQGFLTGIVEAVRPGPEGWVDESISLARGWDDIDLTAIRTSVLWWHGAEDRNAPAHLVQRVIDRLPDGQLRLVPGVGHFVHHTHEAEILGELLAR